MLMITFGISEDWSSFYIKKMGSQKITFVRTSESMREKYNILPLRLFSHDFLFRSKTLCFKRLGETCFEYYSFVFLSVVLMSCV